MHPLFEDKFDAQYQLELNQKAKLKEQKEKEEFDAVNSTSPHAEKNFLNKPSLQDASPQMQKAVLSTNPVIKVENGEVNDTSIARIETKHAGLGDVANIETAGINILKPNDDVPDSKSVPDQSADKL